MDQQKSVGHPLGNKWQEQAERQAAERLVFTLKNRGVDALRMQPEVLKLVRKVVAQLKRENRL